MSARNKLKLFFRPKFSRKYVLRLLVVAVAAFIFFRYTAAPFYIDGDSMAPTYRSGTITFGWRIPWVFSDLDRGDVVIIRLAGRRVTLLKRIVALPGEKIEFRDGDLYVDDVRLSEPYVVKTGDWNLDPRVVEENHFYVVGDNRSGPMGHHVFGQVRKERIIGVPVW